jgi:GxxExxY protein
MEKTPQKRLFPLIPAETEQVGKVILDAAYKVHTALGPGLLESVHVACTAHEIKKSRMLVELEVALPVIYDSVRVDAGLRMDMLVKKCVIVEFKAVETMHPVYEAQLLTYLRLSGVRLGFLINFNVPHLKDGIKRIVV